MRGAIIAAGVALGIGALWYRQAQANIDQSAGDYSPGVGIIGGINDMIGAASSAITPFSVACSLPGNAVYVDYIRQVEMQKGIPENLMVRVAWQECRFRADVIEGRKVSGAGAKGMWQLMPIHWRFVDPLDWQASANYAGDMLVRLYNRFGTWALALAAYNWGEGNLSKNGIGAAPAETRNYYAQILGDIGQQVIV